MGSRLEIGCAKLTRLLRCRDLDQISADLRSPKHLAQHKSSKAAEDLPGLGKWYCIQCAKWYESENSMVSHLKGKPHKRRYVGRL